MRKAGIILLWAVVSAVVLFLVTLPISLQAQLIAGLAVLAAMMVLKLIRPHGIWRLIALAFGTAIVMRYVYWRTTRTLPPLNQLENFIPGVPALSRRDVQCRDARPEPFVVASPLPPRRAHADLERTATADGRRLRPDLQRGRRTCWPPPGRGQGDGLSGRQVDRLAARRWRHRCRSATRTDRAKRRGAETAA